LSAFAIFALIVGGIKRDDVRGRWLDSRYEFIPHFLVDILWAVLAWATFWILGFLTLGIGMAVLWILPLIVLVWYLYRMIKGWMRLNERERLSRWVERPFAIPIKHLDNDDGYR
jgi:uncharacterized membrane protein